MPKISQDAVLQALRTVQDPDLHRDLVSLDMIRDLVVTDDAVSVRVMLTTPACPLKDKIEGDVRAALKTVPGVTTITIMMDAE
ncbi:MAG: iron-sulfur cluster assembly protein, partial [Bdellovibrionota bacterium]